MTEAMIANVEINFNGARIPAHETIMFVGVDYIEFIDANVPDGTYNITLTEIRPPYLSVANNNDGLMGVQVRNNRISNNQLAMDVHNSSNMEENLSMVLGRAVLVKI